MSKNVQIVRMTTMVVIMLTLIIAAFMASANSAISTKLQSAQTADTSLRLQLVSDEALAPHEASGKPSQWGNDLEPVYCGPGLSYTYFDANKGRSVTTCLKEYYIPEPISVKRPPTWWNPWTWF